MTIDLLRNEILHGNVIDKLKELDEKSVHCCVTSPPYYGVRNYGTNPQIWTASHGENCEHTFVPDNRKHNLGGTSEKSTLRDTPGQKAKEGWAKGVSCEHEFVSVETKRNNNGGGDTEKQKTNTGSYLSGFCIRCGAWKGELGLEPTPELYIEHLVQIFREVRRVLRKDGTCWLNLGDSYWGSGGTSGQSPEHLNLGKTRTERYYAVNGLTQGEKHSYFKPKDQLLIPHRVAIALQQDGWWVRSDIVWCLSGGVWVYARTQKGDMPMTIKDMCRLKPNTVQLWNGEKWTKVLGWTKTRRSGKEIEIELRSGERISETPNHEFPTQRGLIRADELKVSDIIDSCLLPESENPKTPEYISDDAAWFIGLYLAEGSQSDGTIQIAGHIKETERWDRCQRFVKSYGGYLFKYVTHNSATININSKIILSLVENFTNGKTAKDKGLKVECWKYNNRFLEKILNGYLEGDAHWDNKNNRWRLGFTRNYNLEQSLRTLCARLGYRIKLKLGYAKNQNGKYPAFHGELRKEFNQSHSNAKNYNEIIAVRKARCRFVYDIAVEDEPHLFALASGVLTHNSKKNPMPESVTDRPSKAHEYIFLLTKSQKYFYDAEAIREKPTSGPSDLRKMLEQQDRIGGKTLSAADPLYKANMNTNIGQKRGVGDPIAGRNKRSVWEVTTTPFAEAHFATFPEKLVEPYILAGTSEHGVCAECGKPYERILERETRHKAAGQTELQKQYRKRGSEHQITPIDQPNRGSVDKPVKRMPGEVPRAESATKFDITNSTAGRLATYRQGARAYDAKYHTNEEGLFLNASERSITIQSEREESKTEAAELYPDDYEKQQWYINYVHEHGRVKQNRTIGWRKTCKCETNEVRPAIVLDPFFGAGTTGLVARKGNRDFVGIELNEKYIEIAKKRLATELEVKLI